MTVSLLDMEQKHEQQLSSSKNSRWPSAPSTQRNSPLQLLHRHGDLQVVAQNMESSEDVSPLDHLS